MLCFIRTLRLLLHIDVIHQASASCLGPGPKLNGYSITYVIHSLRTSCSELEWV